MDQPGLEKRMGSEARRISSQHRQLDELYALVADAVGRGDAAEAHRGFVRFGDALEAHFSLEDGLYFPALHGMRRDLEAELEALSREHAEFRAQLAELGRLLEAGDLARCDGQLDRFVVALARHEGREEQLLERIRRSGEA